VRARAAPATGTAARDRRAPPTRRDGPERRDAIGADLRERGLDVERVLSHLPGRFQRPEGIVHAVTAMLGA
jgi:hypothetical protein